MSNQVQFWFNPTTGTVSLFFFTTLILGVLAISIRFLFNRLQNKRKEQEFQGLLAKHDLLGKPEEFVLRDLVAKNKISPPASILSNLQTYDQLAGEEIQRAQRASLPLADRIDRIEYLYSIRLQAFAHDPSVGGIGSLFPKPLPEIAASPPSESEVEDPDVRVAEGGEAPSESTQPTLADSSEEVPENPPESEADDYAALGLDDDAMATLLGNPNTDEPAPSEGEAEDE